MDIKEDKNSAKAQEQSCKVVNYMRLFKISFGGYPFAFVMSLELNWTSLIVIFKMIAEIVQLYTIQMLTYNN